LAYKLKCDISIKAGLFLACSLTKIQKLYRDESKALEIETSPFSSPFVLLKSSFDTIPFFLSFHMLRAHLYTSFSSRINWLK
jgi:hypothetical protein